MFAPQLEVVPLESRLDVLEVTGDAQSGVLPETIALVMLTVPPLPFEIPPLVLLAIVTLNRFVVDPPKVPIPTWLLEFVVLRIVVVAPERDETPAACVLPEICEFSRSRMPELLTAAPVAWVPTSASWSISTWIPGATTNRSGRAPASGVTPAPLI